MNKKTSVKDPSKIWLPSGRRPLLTVIWYDAPLFRMLAMYIPSFDMGPAAVATSQQLPD